MFVTNREITKITANESHQIFRDFLLVFSYTIGYRTIVFFSRSFYLLSCLILFHLFHRVTTQSTSFSHCINILLFRRILALIPSLFHSLALTLYCMNIGTLIHFECAGEWETTTKLTCIVKPIQSTDILCITRAPSRNIHMFSREAKGTTNIINIKCILYNLKWVSRQSMFVFLFPFFCCIYVKTLSEENSNGSGSNSDSVVVFFLPSNFPVLCWYVCMQFSQFLTLLETVNVQTTQVKLDILIHGTHKMCWKWKIHSRKNATNEKEITNKPNISSERKRKSRMESKVWASEHKNEI